MSVTIESEATTNFADFYPIFPDLSSFLVVDTRSVEMTIARGQNMQICHSLICKQIDVNGRPIDIDFSK